MSVTALMLAAFGLGVVFGLFAALGAFVAIVLWVERTESGT